MENQQGDIRRASKPSRLVTRVYILGDFGRSTECDSTWDMFCRRHGQVAVCTPVLDLAPERKYNRELQKSMSFRNWKPEEIDHPLICKTETYPPDGPPKRAASPTDSQKAKLDSMRAAMKSSWRRAMMKRPNSPDSVGYEQSPFMSKDLPACLKASEKLLALTKDDASSELSPSVDSPCTVNDAVMPWEEEDDQSLVLSHDDKALWVDDIDWEPSDDDEPLATPDSQALSPYLRQAWSVQPLDSMSDGEPEGQPFLRLRGSLADCYDDEDYYGNKTLGNPGVPTHKSMSDDTDDEEEPVLHNRFHEGLLNAGKKVLSSVWTWAVVVVFYAGVKTLSSYTGTPSEAPTPDASTKYCTESTKIEFDWDDDVEFKFHTLSRC